MNLTQFYMNTFGTTEFWGLNLGFYFTMLAVLIIVVVENVADDRKFMMLALENSNPDITRLYLDECGDK